jgi:GDP-L-fucose synthase
MNAIITGNTGYLGRALQRSLEYQGWNIVGLNSTHGNLLDHGPEALAMYINMHEDFVSTEEVDIIFHLAAVAKAGDWHLSHKGEVWEQNQKLNTSILEFWRLKCPQAKLIAMGTSCSYDPILPLKEENYLRGYPDEGLSTYAFTKRMLLVGLRSYSDQYGLKYNYLIPSTIYGPDFAEGDSHFIFDLIKKIYAGVTYGSPVELWGDGNQKRELIYITDVVRTLNEAIFLENSVLNVGFGQEYSIRTYANLISKYLHFDFEKIIFNKNKYVGVKSKLLDIAHTQSLIPSYREQLTGLIPGLEQTLTYYKNLHASNN